VITAKPFIVLLLKSSVFLRHPRREVLKFLKLGFSFKHLSHNRMIKKRSR
jgi:hypothetical protein